MWVASSPLYSLFPRKKTNLHSKRIRTQNCFPCYCLCGKKYAIITRVENRNQSVGYVEVRTSKARRNSTNEWNTVTKEQQFVWTFVVSKSWLLLFASCTICKHWSFNHFCQMVFDRITVIFEFLYWFYHSNYHRTRVEHNQYYPNFTSLRSISQLEKSREQHKNTIVYVSACVANKLIDD